MMAELFSNEDTISAEDTEEYDVRTTTLKNSGIEESSKIWRSVLHAQGSASKFPQNPPGFLPLLARD